jgi:hypothetical protein
LLFQSLSATQPEMVNALLMMSGKQLQLIIHLISKLRGAPVEAAFTFEYLGKGPPPRKASCQLQLYLPHLNVLSLCERMNCNPAELTVYFSKSTSHKPVPLGSAEI